MVSSQGRRCDMTAAQPSQERIRSRNFRNVACRRDYAQCNGERQEEARAPKQCEPRLFVLVLRGRRRETYGWLERQVGADEVLGSGIRL
jgi:hypothetical protein